MEDTTNKKTVTDFFELAVGSWNPENFAELELLLEREYPEIDLRKGKQSDDKKIINACRITLVDLLADIEGTESAQEIRRIVKERIADHE